MKRNFGILRRLYMSLNKVLEKICITSCLKWLKAGEIGCDIFLFLFCQALLCK